MNPFTIRVIKENDQDYYVVTVGNYLSNDTKFSTYEEAEKLINKLDDNTWLLIGSLISAIIDNLPKLKQEIEKLESGDYNVNSEEL